MASAMAATTFIVRDIDDDGEIVVTEAIPTTNEARPTEPSTQYQLLATVLLPASGKLGRRRITLDGLARLAGLRRPAIANDPVHFKYTGGTRTVSLRRPHNA